MSCDTGFLSLLFQKVEDLFEPLSDAFSSEGNLQDFLLSFGWITPSNTFTISSIKQNLNLVQNIITDVEAVIQSVEQVIDQGPSAILSNIGIIVNSISNLISDVEALSQYATTTPNANNLPYAFTQKQFWQEFTEQIVQELIIRYLQNHQGQIYSSLKVLGVIEEELVQIGITPGVPADPNRVNFRKRSFCWAALLGMINSPKQITQIDFSRIATLFQETFIGVGLMAYLQPADKTIYANYYNSAYQNLNNLQELRIPIVGGIDSSGNPFGFELSILPIPDEGDTNGAPTGIAISPIITGTIPSDASFITLTGGFQTDQGITLEIHPNTPIKVNVATKAGISLSLVPQGPIVLLGGDQSGNGNSTNGIQISKLNIGLDVSPPFNDPDITVFADFGDVTASIATSEDDSFLSEILPKQLSVTINDFGIRWSSKHGLSFKGAVSLETTITLSQELGPIDLEGITIGLAEQNSNLAIVLSVSGGVTLGPITGTVDKVGLQLIVKPNLVDTTETEPIKQLPLSLGFKPPDGLGIEIDAGSVVGGGYISFNQDKGEYAGILELSVGIPLEAIQIKIIGLLDTKMPDGSSGYSFLLIVDTEFPPIQLGFGFELEGIGGLGGVNRSMSTDALQAGIKNKTIDNILFPEDPVANAPQVISDVATVFPIAKGRYVFGPMLKLGWSDIVEAELGVVLEMPEPVRLAILGEFSVMLPVQDPDLAIVVLNLDILGILDFGKKKFSLDGSLHDSRIITFPLTGDMAMRLNYGRDHPAFIIAVGGVHPKFTQAATLGLPANMQRVGFSMGSDKVGLSLKAYFAASSNSLQFGPDADLHASAIGFTLHGYLSFDALFIIDPFSFEVDVAAGVDLLAGTTKILAVDLGLTLTGPTPWHIVGSASITIVLVSVTLPVDVTIGSKPKPSPPQPVCVIPQVVASLSDPGSWNGQLSPNDQYITVTKQQTTQNDQSTIAVHPAAALQVRQKIVPFNLQISKFNGAPPADANSFDMSVTVANISQNYQPEDLCDEFAIGQFQDMTDDEKLSSNSYEPCKSGVTINPPPLPGANSDLEAQWVTTIIDPTPCPPLSGSSAPPSPTLLLSPSWAPAGTDVTISGAGFSALSGIIITSSTTALTPPSTITDSAGSFSVIVTIPAAGLAVGETINISATDGTNTELAILTVTQKYKMQPYVQNGIKGSSAAATAPFRTTGPSKFISDGTSSPISLSYQKYIVVSTTDLSIRGDISCSDGVTMAKAKENLKKYLSSNPADVGKLQVITLYEQKMATGGAAAA